MVYIIIFWPIFCALNAWMQGRVMPAVRRTPPDTAEAKEQDNALHKVGAAAYFLPLLLTPATLLFGALVALAARVALFDVVLNTAARRPAFEVGQTAMTDRWLRRLAPNNPARLSALLRLTAAALLGGGAVWVAMYAH